MITITYAPLRTLIAALSAVFASKYGVSAPVVVAAAGTR